MGNLPDRKTTKLAYQGSAGSSTGYYLALCALATVGFVSTIAQLVLVREIVATFYGNELLYGLLLFSWLAWVAAGSWGLARLTNLRQAGTQAIALCLGVIALVMPLQIVFVRGIRALLGVTPGAFVEFGPMVATVLLIPAPLCLLTGFLFTASVRMVIERGGKAGHGYALEGLGAVAGGMLFSFVFIHWLDPFQIALLAGTISLVSAICMSVTTPNRRSFLLMLPLGLILLAAAFLVGPGLNRSTLLWQYPNMVFATDSPYGRLVIQARAGQQVFFQNGLLAFDTQSSFPEEVIHFPLLLHPEPRSLLLIGGGVAGDLQEALKQPLSDVTYVELDPTLVQAAEEYLPPNDAAVLHDPRVTVVLGDGRQYLHTASRKFDVVILDLPPPSSGSINRYYTLEFFQEVQNILEPGGILSLGLPSAENYWSPELTRRNGSVLRTLNAAFPEIQVLSSGDHNFFVASAADWNPQPDILKQRLRTRQIDAQRVTPSYLEYVFTTNRAAATEQQLSDTQGIRLNRDLAPICYYYDLALWLSQFYPQLRPFLEGASIAKLGWLIPPLAIIVLLARWKRRWAMPITLAGIGLAQMSLQLLILFGFQVLHGTLYARVSLIVTAFMAGIVIGALVANRFSMRNTARRALLSIQICVMICSGLLLIVLSLPTPAPATVFVLLSVLAGGLTGAAYPLAVTVFEGEERRAAGMLYAADLLGGCVGAALTVTLLIPVLGIPQVCIFVALLGFSGFVALA